jgi:NADPH:quinone reductase-like Zn-dependent oxidoreductase
MVGEGVTDLAKGDRVAYAGVPSRSLLRDTLHPPTQIGQTSRGYLYR